jgi:hypothetical protein
VASAGRTVYLADLRGDPLRSLVGGVSWTLEDRDDSTNRLTVEAPLAQAEGVVVDQELLLAGRRFGIVSVGKSKSGRLAVIEADEVQAELASDPLPVYALDGAYLSAALAEALAPSRWTPGQIDDNTGSYYSEFEGITVMDALAFLTQQSGLRAVFDSHSRVVHLRDMSRVEPDRVFTYGAGVSDIDKTDQAPTYTVIYPTGRDGLTIEGVNDGLPYVEDYGWYTAQGVPLDAARERFRRVEYWEDDRYIYDENLKRAALARLAVSAYPQIAYKVVADGAKTSGLELGSPVWVVDQELGLKLAARVAAITRTQDPSTVDLELGFLPPSQTSVQPGGDVGDSNTGDAAGALFQVKNQAAVQLGADPVVVLSAEINIYADTGLEVGVVAVAEIKAAGLLSGYFLLNGSKLDVQPKQTSAQGWATLGLPFMVTPVVAGPTALDFYLAVEGGSGVVAPLGAEMFIAARGAYGGIKHERPDRTVREDIRRWLDLPALGDSAGAVVGLPVLVAAADAISLPGRLAVADQVASWRPMPLWSVTSGCVLGLWGGKPGEEFTVRADTGVTGALALDADGAGSWDLKALLGLNEGIHDCVILETGVAFDVEAPA